jgi:hypothetical protein
MSSPVGDCGRWHRAFGQTQTAMISKKALAGRDRPWSGSLCGALPALPLSRQWPHRAGMAPCARPPTQNPACGFPAPGFPVRTYVQVSDSRMTGLRVRQLEQRHCPGELYARGDRDAHVGMSGRGHASRPSGGDGTVAGSRPSRPTVSPTSQTVSSEGAGRPLPVSNRDSELCALNRRTDGNERADEPHDCEGCVAVASSLPPGKLQSHSVRALFMRSYIDLSSSSRSSQAAAISNSWSACACSTIWCRMVELRLMSSTN